MQAYTPIQQALDSQLLSGVNGQTAGTLSVWSSGNQTGNLFYENTGFSLAYFNNPTNLVAVRSTLIPISPATGTIGQDGYDLISGFYAVDVMGQMNQGYTATKQLADMVIAAFARGTQLTLSNEESITIEKTGFMPNVTQGAWAMNKLYCVSVRVDWFGYMQGGSS